MGTIRQKLSYTQRGAIFGLILAIISLTIFTVLVYQNDELHNFLESLRDHPLNYDSPPPSACELNRLCVSTEMALKGGWWVYLLLIFIPMIFGNLKDQSKNKVR